MDLLDAGGSDLPHPEGRRDGILDSLMDKQSAFFSSSHLYRSVDLAGPAAQSSLHLRNIENDKALGGMRRPDRSVQQSSRYRQVGMDIFDMASQFITNHPETLEIVSDLRKGVTVTGFSPQVASSFRASWFQVLGSTAPPSSPGPDADVIECWGRAVGDQDAGEFLPHWLRHGAPIGILEQIEVANVFPKVTMDETPRHPDTLYSELAGWANYASAEDEPEVVAKLLGAQEAKGHCKFFDNIQQLEEFLGVDHVVLTKLALITKFKADGTPKHRLIWDLLRSDVNSAVTLTERIVLPRIQDAVEDAMHLRLCGEGDLEWLVLDIADAFHNIPLRPSEWKFACGKVGNRFVVFLVLCMGGKSAPNIWGRYAALLGRMLASTFSPDEFRSEVYVDDPLMAAIGNQDRRDLLFTVALLVLQVSGFPLAWGKGVLGESVIWIGAQLSSLPSGIRVSIPEDKLDALLAQTQELRSSVVASRRSIRAYCGKLSFIGGMVPYIRPFLSMLWAALSSSSRLPSNLIHCRQLMVALDWLHALLLGRHGPLVRMFPLQVHWAADGDYIATDACPWGFAGVLFKDHSPISWFATPLTGWDLRRFRARKGDSKHNTTWEALALLVAIRLWLPGTSVLARVRSDSLSALRSMVKLASRSPDLNLIARELALDAVLGLYTIGMATHIPGVSNKLPDDLSRMWAPDPHVFPIELSGIPEVMAPPRDRTFWRTTSIKHRAGTTAARRRANQQGSL